MNAHVIYEPPAITCLSASMLTLSKWIWKEWWIPKSQTNVCERLLIQNLPSADPGTAVREINGPQYLPVCHCACILFGRTTSGSSTSSALRSLWGRVQPGWFCLCVCRQKLLMNPQTIIGREFACQRNNKSFYFSDIKHSLFRLTLEMMSDAIY
jgi:hypothetical protein